MYLSDKGVCSVLLMTYLSSTNLMLVHVIKIEGVIYIIIF